MLQTALGDALSKAGVDVDAARLAVVATKALRHAEGDPRRAFGRFAEIIETDRGLRRAMIQAYLNDRADDMRGDPLRRGALHQGSLVAQNMISPAPQPHDDGLAQPDGGAEASNPALAAPSSPDDGVVALPESGKQSVRSLAAAPSPQSTPKPAPNPPRDMARILAARAAVAASRLDTFTLRDGRPIGDVLFHELRKIPAANDAELAAIRRESALMRSLTAKYANAPDHARVRDIVSPRLFDEALAEVEAIHAA